MAGKTAGGAATKAARTILVILKNGKRIMVENIPSTAKITYGPVSPGARDYQQGNALRIYTSQQNQLAVFTEVREFRDLSLTVKEEKVVTASGKASTVSSKGRAESVDHVESREWEEVSF